MLKIAVCDDNPEDLARVTALLERYLARNHIPGAMDGYNNAMDLMDALSTGSYDLLLLDILMPGFTGLQAARELRRFDSETKIIFLTSSPEYAVESYRVEAFYYLLKPVKEGELFPILDKLLRELQKNENALLLTLPSGVVRLPLSRLEVLEINSKRLLFHLNDGSIREVRGTLSEYEPKLLKSGAFVKVHRSYLVNMDCILRLGANELTTCAGKTVPVSRLVSGEVRRAYLDYLFPKENEA